MKKILVMIVILCMFSTSVLALEYQYAVAPIYKGTTSFYKGIAVVTNEENETAVVDRYGNIVIDFSSNIKRIRKNGLIMIIGDNDKAAFFSSGGDMLTDYIYDTFPYTHPKTHEKTYYVLYSIGDDGDGKSDLISVSRDARFGYLNSLGEEQIPLQFDFAGGFHDGFADIRSGSTISIYGTYINCKYGLIAQDGTIIAPADSFWTASYHTAKYGRYKFHIGSLSRGYWLVNDGNASYMTGYDNTLKRLDSDGFAAVGAPYVILANSKKGTMSLVNGGKNTIIPEAYHTIRFFGDNFLVTDSVNKVVDSNNEVLTVFDGFGADVLSHKEYHSGHFATVRKAAHDGIDGHTVTGLVNSEGKIILPIEYEEIDDLGEGLIYARTLSENLLFDYSGNPVCKLNGRVWDGFCDGLIRYTDFDTMKMGYLKNPLLYPKIYIGSKQLSSDVDAKIESGRTMIPMRSVFEALEAQVEWNDRTRTVIAIKGDIRLDIAVDSLTYYVNDVPMLMDVPARLENNRVLIPLRVASESLGFDVKWNDKERVIHIAE